MVDMNDPLIQKLVLDYCFSKKVTLFICQHAFYPEHKLVIKGNFRNKIDLHVEIVIETKNKQKPIMYYDEISFDAIYEFINESSFLAIGLKSLLRIANIGPLMLVSKSFRKNVLDHDIWNLLKNHIAFKTIGDPAKWLYDSNLHPIFSIVTKSLKLDIISKQESAKQKAYLERKQEESQKRQNQQGRGKKRKNHQDNGDLPAKRQRTCGSCGKEGHNKRTCNQKD